jgi:hypothetical protein
MRILVEAAVRNYQSSDPFPLAVRPNGTRVFLLQTTIRQSKTFSLKRLREEPLGAILLHAWHIDSAFVRANLEIRILPCFPPLDPAM